MRYPLTARVAIYERHATLWVNGYLRLNWSPSLRILGGYRRMEERP